jgi:hypothetical protein
MTGASGRAKTSERWKQTKDAWAKAMIASRGDSAAEIDKAHANATAIRR